MLKTSKENIESLLGSKTKFDIVILMNSCDSRWDANYTVKHLQKVYPNSFGADKNSKKPPLSRIGTFENPMQEKGRKDVFLNVYTRLSNKCLINDEEVKNMEKALSSVLAQTHYKKILVISPPNLSARNVIKHANSLFSGNKVIVI